jgi:hypothetical protein
MIKNRIYKLPILNSTGDKIIGIVYNHKPSHVFSLSKRPGLVTS